jgi:phosphoserine phosphatase RsbU/P
MSTSPAPPRTVPAPVSEMLEEFAHTYSVGVRLWRPGEAGWSVVAGSDAGGSEAPAGESIRLHAGYTLETDPPMSDPAFRFLASALDHQLRIHGELLRMTDEIAGRYEEITLLYSISETLGSVISLEEAAGKILHEVIGILGARRAALWVHDADLDILYLAAAQGLNGQSGPIRVDDRTSVTAQVFRRRRPVIMDPGDVFPRGDLDRGNTQRGSFLSVPVSYTPPRGKSRTIGVINLVGRESDEPFTAGDQNLLSAIASQVGAAVENGRLVAESLRQERVVRELELARDLQMKLLPSADRFAGYARIGVRCVPAHTVGGDFYHLFRLSNGRLGVMIGDVSSHGFSAALIMALTMSAVAIHASEGHPPAEVLQRVHRALIDELETTEMFLTLFYGVIDPAAGRIDFANAGHHHAFRIDERGEAERLGVTNPPFGMVDLDAYAENAMEWRAGSDTLFLFTDGLSDALGLGEAGGERRLIEIVARDPGADPDTVLDELFSEVAPDGPHGIDDRSAVIARI